MTRRRKWQTGLVLVTTAFALPALVATPASAAASYSWSQVIGAAGCTTACAGSPPARFLESIAYDAATSQVVVFGGYNQGGTATLNDTWVYNGSSWTQVIGTAGCTTACTGSPPADANAGMTYDAATGDVVLFGGSGGSTYLNATWVYNGSSWTQVVGSPGCTTACAGSPPGRLVEGQMAYDAATGDVVLFGGYNGSYLNDTWVYNGSTWAQVIGTSGCTTACTGSPPARYRGAMAYDTANSQVVLFGGNNGSDLNDTWVYNGSTWTQVIGTSGCTTACTGGPSARDNLTMASDPAVGNVVLFSGNNGTSGTNETWVYNGTSWTQVIDAGCTTACTSSPTARGSSAMAFDGATAQLVVFGGYGAAAATGLNDTWILPLSYQLQASLGVAAGTLGFISTPTSFSFAGITLNGSAQSTPASIALDIGDATGSGAGWNVQLSATTFTNTNGNTLSDSDFQVTGSSPPAVACDSTSSCTVASLANLYPYTLSGTATKLLSAAVGTGMGDQTVTVPWTATIPANAYAGTYQSTWTFSLVSGP